VTRAPLALIAALFLLAPAQARAGEWPMQLPGAATAASVRSDPDTWIVGARPGAAASRIARRFGARHIGLPQTGGYEVAIGRARAMAAALEQRRLLVYAQPNVLLHTSQVADDPLSVPPNAWRAHVADPSLVPPPVSPTSPLIALVDAAADATHKEWAGDPNFASTPARPVTNVHGTATASVAAAPANGVGILGVWPGARALNVALQTSKGSESFSCAASGDAIAQAIQAGAAVINMSYGSQKLCAPEKVQIYYGVAKGIIPVAAAGNEFEEGNPLEYPANLPHVVSVAATDNKDHSASFSNANDWVDLSAPGVGIMTAVPPALDDDGVQDGYELLSGTSFAAPMVSAALAWVRQARPELQPDQAVQAVRLSAHDVGRKGWDPLTGFGVLDIAAALKAPVARLPAHDPLEPNDNISWVDGRAFGTPAPPVWTGPPARLDAQLDKEEDPVDVYRIVVPAHGRVKVTVVPRFGDIQLEVFRSDAISIHDTGARANHAHRPGKKKTEHATVRNAGARPHPYYLTVTPQGRSRYQDRRYTLKVG
jgi:subtilisin family serine protease